MDFQVRGPGLNPRGEMRHLVGVGLGECWPGHGARDLAAAADTPLKIIVAGHPRLFGADAS